MHHSAYLSTVLGLASLIQYVTPIPIFDSMGPSHLVHTPEDTPVQPRAKTFLENNRHESDRYSILPPTIAITPIHKMDSTMNNSIEEYEPEKKRGKSIMPTRGQALRKGLVVSKLEYSIGMPVMTEPINVYYIWYGKWTNAKHQDYLVNLIKDMDKTAWYGMMKKYYYQASENDPKVYVSGKVSFGKSVSDDYSLGNHIKDQDVPRLIQKYIDAKELPEDKNGVYFIIPSADVDGSVDQDKFGEAYCGYHDAGNLSNGNKVFYSVIHDPQRHMGSCGPRIERTASGHPPLDAMASNLAHELVEVVSDPDASDNRAWEDIEGVENADKCAYRYGKTLKNTKGGMYNIKVEDREYLIQQNWCVVKQACSMD